MLGSGVHRMRHGLSAGQFLCMAQGGLHGLEVVRAGFGKHPKHAAYRLCHHDMHALRYLRQHRADRISDLGKRRQYQFHA